MSKIRGLIDSLIANIEMYEIAEKQISGNSKLEIVKQKLELKKDLIYKDFFELQNLINLFINQKIIMTYVHVDPVAGTREIRLFDNSIDHLQVQEGVGRYGGSYATLRYDVGAHYELLKNSLSDEENQGLQLTASEVEARYAKYKGKILWKINNDWIGYRLYNRGPINEAFVSFYLKEVQLKNSLHNNIHTFMTSDDPSGVIKADNANGFLIGDVSIGGLQFAVKGAFGGPQNFKRIVTWLKKIKQDNFSDEAFNAFIQRFKEIEIEKSHSLAKELMTDTIQTMITTCKEELLNDLVIK